MQIRKAFFAIAIVTSGVIAAGTTISACTMSSEPVGQTSRASETSDAGTGGDAGADTCTAYDGCCAAQACPIEAQITNLQEEIAAIQDAIEQSQSTEYELEMKAMEVLQQIQLRADAADEAVEDLDPVADAAKWTGNMGLAVLDISLIRSLYKAAAKCVVQKQALSAAICRGASTRSIGAYKGWVTRCTEGLELEVGKASVAKATGAAANNEWRSLIPVYGPLCTATETREKYGKVQDLLDAIQRDVDKLSDYHDELLDKIQTVRDKIDALEQDKAAAEQELSQAYSDLMDVYYECCDCTIGEGNQTCDYDAYPGRVLQCNEQDGDFVLGEVESCEDGEYCEEDGEGGAACYGSGSGYGGSGSGYSGY